MFEKRFLVKDLSGRGITVTLPLSDIRESWDLEYKNSPNDDCEDSLGNWLETAEVGDTFANEEENVTFTRTA